MIVPSVLLFAGADAAARVRYNKHATVEKYGAQHLGNVNLGQFLMTWNATMGPPPRGWYQAQFFMDKHANNNEVIKKSGEDGQTLQTFNFDEFPKEHFCRYRNDDAGADDTCCDEEDQNCYTKAGCYCDTACFTIYGDCCTDHFVTCYDDLKLCLKKVKSEDGGNSLAKDLAGNHSGGKKPRPRAEMQHDAVNPAHVEPNACCGQDEYNDEDKCCVTNGGRRSLVKKEDGDCGAEEEEGVDSRIQSSDSEEEEDGPMYEPEYEEE